MVTRLRPLATGAAVAAILGIGGFLWSILGDLFAGFPSLAGPLQTVTPAFFQIGALVLLIQLAVARRVPFWTPVLMLVGFSVIGIDLDLLPVGAVIVFIGVAAAHAGIGRGCPLTKADPLCHGSSPGMRFPK
jgi:hypothetical protein